MPNKPLEDWVSRASALSAARWRGFIADGAADFAVRTGRRPEIVAYSARAEGARGLPLDGAAFYADPAEMAARGRTSTCSSN